MPHVSVVLPIRNAEDRIIDEVQRILDALSDLSDECCEIVIIDDASNDMTPELLDEIRTCFPQVHVHRLEQPRGLEAAGQTGFSMARGSIVFIQEDNGPIRIEDLRRLYQLASDESIVAARAHSTTTPPSVPIRRRLAASGVTTPEPLQPPETPQPKGPWPKRPESASLQMIRPAAMTRLAHTPAGQPLPLQSDWLDLTSVVN
jgi:glycosyltransferase involved in cell wall biosynthesis